MVGVMPIARLLELIAPPLCWSCGGSARAHEPLCAGCRRGLRWLGGEPERLHGLPVWAPVAYEGPARRLVQALKFRGAAAVAGPLAAQIVANAPPAMLAPGTALVPVPLQPARLRRRGFNQAERIAAGVARRARLELADCLERPGASGPGAAATQVGRGRADRLAALAGAIRLRPPAAPPARALLVDDVITTGATLAACAAALRAAGTREVAAIAYARTPGR